jgi:hypothetical protein
MGEVSGIERAVREMIALRKYMIGLRNPIKRSTLQTDRFDRMMTVSIKIADRRGA